MRIRKRRVAGLLIVIAAIAAALNHQLPASSSSSPSLTSDASRPETRGAPPGVANLDPALLGALRQATARAADDGIELQVDSGWRSPEHQEQLLKDAVSKYGSEQEAARWVATPDTSAHVSGDAVDLGPPEAAAWLSQHGAEHGLCQVYGNEPWHYELRPDATDQGCPPVYADPTHDPRMQQ